MTTETDPGRPVPDHASGGCEVVFTPNPPAAEPADNGPLGPLLDFLKGMRDCGSWDDATMKRVIENVEAQRPHIESALTRPVMSKNPPKPNTSPDHVKETAEAFTCPSHTEARERLEAEAHRALEACRSAAKHQAVVPADHEKELASVLEHATATVRLEDLRTLLATPTQEPADQFPHQAFLRACGPRVGREEIARIIDPRTFERWDVLCDQAGEIEADRQYGAACARAFVKADAILSLLPAPKPGEGRWVPYEGEPERGWLYAAAPDDQVMSPGLYVAHRIPPDSKWIMRLAPPAKFKPQQPAALTSSSAKPGGEEKPHCPDCGAPLDACCGEPGAPEGWRDDAVWRVEGVAVLRHPSGRRYTFYDGQPVIAYPEDAALKDNGHAGGAE